MDARLVNWIVAVLILIVASVLAFVQYRQVRHRLALRKIRAQTRPKKGERPDVLLFHDGICYDLTETGVRQPDTAAGLAHWVFQAPQRGVDLAKSSVEVRELPPGTVIELDVWPLRAMQE